MIDDLPYKELRDQSWRRKLTDEEEAALRGWLAAHPEAQADWDLEAGLNEALTRLPEAPVPSNFTARVLQAVELEQRKGARREGGGSFWARLRWVPKFAVVAVVLCAGLISYQQIEIRHNHERMQAVVAVAGVSSLPGPDVLKDFNAIQALSQTPADEELLAAFQ